MEIQGANNKNVYERILVQCLYPDDVVIPMSYDDPSLMHWAKRQLRVKFEIYYWSEHHLYLTLYFNIYL